METTKRSVPRIAFSFISFIPESLSASLQKLAQGRQSGAPGHRAPGAGRWIVEAHRLQITHRAGGPRSSKLFQGDASLIQEGSESKPVTRRKKGGKKEGNKNDARSCTGRIATPTFVVEAFWLKRARPVLCTQNRPRKAAPFRGAGP